ncbi:hypothetical protein DYB36_009339, partial [Aphanomyces astaci]
VLVLLILAVWWWCRRREPSPRSSTTPPHEKPSVDLVVHDDYVEVVEHDTCSRPEGDSADGQTVAAAMKHVQNADVGGDVDVAAVSILDAHRLPHPVVLLEAVLGRGTYGEVILGHYHDTLVAVKRLRPDHNNPKNMQSLVQEIELMTRFHSPFLVHFIGATWTHPDMDDLLCVVEYMDLRDLQSYLAKSKAGPKKSASFSWPQKMTCARHMALALSYLHDQQVIHRDVKSPNVLLNQSMAAKLGDFGIARQVVEKSMSNAVGTYRWTAPEVLKGKYYSVKADVYSFGMVLSELDTHVVPYYGMTNPKGQELGNFTIMFQCEKTNGRAQASVEIWDCSGDQVYEACWPAILKDASATIIVYNPDSHVHESEVTLWYEWFVQNAALEPAQCLVFAHANGKVAAATRGKVNLPPSVKTIQTNYESPGVLKSEFDAFVFGVMEQLQQRQGRTRK